MITIYKYLIDITDRQTIKLPADAEFLKVDVQNDTPYLWAMVNTSKQNIDYDIVIYGTGHDIRSWETLKHIGSFFHKNTFVWHVFHELPF
jgi:hypothetical protein